MSNKIVILFAAIVVLIVIVGAIALNQSAYRKNESGSMPPLATVTPPKQTPSPSTPPETGTTPSSEQTPATIPNPCIVPVSGAGTYLHIISDSTQQALSGITIHVTPTAPTCPVTSGAGPFTKETNISGWVSIGTLPSNYYFDVSLGYEGRGYNFAIPQRPLAITYSTLRLPSGNLSITVCESTGVCRPYNETTAVTVTVTATKP